MSFYKTHGINSGLGAALGAASGLCAAQYLFETPESLLNKYLPLLVENVGISLGLGSELHEFASWWPRDMPVYYMLPVTMLFLYLVSFPCSPKPSSVASLTLAEDKEQSAKSRDVIFEVEMRQSELRTPSNKTFGKHEKEVAEAEARTHAMTQAAADAIALEQAAAEHEAFLAESALEWRLLRLQFVASYATGWLSAYFFGYYGLAAVPLLAFGMPTIVFLLMVTMNVLGLWAAYLCGSCCVLGSEESGASAWGVALKKAEAAGEGGGVCGALCACLGSCCSGEGPPGAYWGVQLKESAKTPPPSRPAKKWTPPSSMV